MVARVCTSCGVAKAKAYYTKASKICNLCATSGAEAPTPEPKVVDVPPEAIDISFPTVELDYDEPSTREIAARIVARRNLLAFIKRFKPKYTAGWVHEDICRRLERFLVAVENGEEPRLLLMMPPRAGKQLADSTAVPTPDGWTTHGQLSVGSQLFHPSGKIVRVLAVSEKTPANVLVTFTDGSAFRCHENHVWSLYDRARGILKNVSTTQLLRTKPASRTRFQVTPCAALAYDGTELSIDPYTLGAWLGDGSAGKPCITGTTTDNAIIAKIERAGYAVSTRCVHSTTGCVTTYFSGDNVEDVGLTPRRNGKRPGRLSQELMALGIFYKKRIPEKYQRLTTAHRLELLAGLIDTDGSVDKHSRATISTVSQELATDVMELCTGLGFRPYIQTAEPRLSTSGIQGRKKIYIVGFQPTVEIPVALPRKRIERLAAQRKAGVQSAERIVATEYGHCIQVDSPDGLYVIGKNLITTHNSEIGSRHFAPFVLGHHPDWEIIAASHTNSLTMSFSRYIRDLLRDPSYHALFPNTILDPASQSVENWNLTAGGGYLAAGVGTGITGRGAHILLLDDLIKDIEAADSQTQRENTWEWYASTAYTRLAPGGGVLGIMCMVGETQVRMADGTEQRLDSLNVGDEIATYENGKLSQSVVKGLKSNGLDLVYKIKTSSGKIAYANGRHPFLAVINGELKWVRTQSLSTVKKIVTLQGSGGNGTVLPAPQTGVNFKPCAVGTVNLTTAKNAGQMGTDQLATAQGLVAMHDSNIAMELLQRITTSYSRSKKAFVLFVKTRLHQISLSIGETCLQWIIAMLQAKYGACCVTTATQESDILNLSVWHVPQPGISNFTLDDVVSVELTGTREVFDVQIDRTENFIADGIVSHNTWWNEDDWAGRIQQVMESGEGDRFEIVRYPAINDEGDEYILPDDTIVQLRKGVPIPEGARMTRPMDTAIHPERYSTAAMLRIMANLVAAGQKRIWSALYQQNPTPDEGLHFTKKMFRDYSHQPQTLGANIYQAWDFAITEGAANDWTVGITVLHDSNDDIFILDVLRFRSGDGEEIVSTIVNYAMEWNATTLGFEDGQIWKALNSTFGRVCLEKKYYPSYEILKPLTDKLVRSQPLRGRMQAGKIHFPTKGAWVKTLKDEMLKFPGGKHDDQVDALSWVVRLILLKSPPRMPDVKPLPSWKDKLKGMMKGAEGSHMSA